MALTPQQLAARGLDDDQPSRIAPDPVAADDAPAAPAPVDGKRIGAALDFASQHFSVDKNVLAGMMMRESSAAPDVVSGARTSSAGAVGLMQFMPATAKRYGIDPTDPVASIMAAAGYMADNLKRFDGDYPKAIAAYNWGEGNVEKQGLGAMPKETRDYLAFVQDFAQQQGSKPWGSASTPVKGLLPGGVTPSTVLGGRGVQGAPTAAELAAHQPGLIEDTWTGLKSTGNKALGAALHVQAEGLKAHLGEPQGFDEAGNPIAPARQADVDAVQQQSLDATRRGIKDAPQRWSGQLASGLAYGVAGPLAPAAVMGVEYNAIKQELMDRGADDETAGRAAAMGGGVLGLAQMIPGGKVAFNAGLTQLLKSGAVAAVKSGAIGAGQKVVGDVGQSAMLAAGGQDALADQVAPHATRAYADELAHVALFQAGAHLGGQAAHALPGAVSGTAKTVDDGLMKVAGAYVDPNLTPAEQLRSVRDAPEAVKARNDAQADTQKQTATENLAKATTVDDMVNAATDLAIRPVAETPAPSVAERLDSPSYLTADAARLAKLQEAIDAHTELLDTASRQANPEAARDATAAVADQLATELPGRTAATTLPEVGTTDPMRGRYDGPLRQLAIDDARAQAGLPSSADARVAMPSRTPLRTTGVIPDLHAPEGVRVTDAENARPDMRALPDSTPVAPKRVDPIVDSTPMTPVQAKQRLTVMRDQLTTAGGDPSTLVLTQHPNVRGRVAIRSTDPTHTLTPEATSGVKAPDNTPRVIDPIDAYVKGKRSENTPAGREFARSFDEGQITRDDVRSVMDREARGRAGDNDIMARAGGLDETGETSRRMIQSDPATKPRGDSAEREQAIRDSFVPPEVKEPPRPPEEPPVVEPPKPPVTTGEAKIKDLFANDTQNPELRSAVKASSMPRVLDVLAKSKNPLHQKIAELMRPIAARMQMLPSRMVPWGSKHRNAAGLYFHDDRIALRENFNGTNYEGNEHTVAHELAHALSARAINNPNDAQRPHVERLKRLYQAVKPQLAKRGFYGMKNLHEFHSEAWTNPEFQQALHDIPMGKTNAWTRFVHTIADLMGIKHSTAFTEFLGIGEALSKTAKQNKPLRAGAREPLASEHDGPEREQLRWRGQETTPEGPRYKGDGFSLLKPERLAQKDFHDHDESAAPDFTDPAYFSDKTKPAGPRSMADAGLLGHAERVVPDTETYHWEIRDAANRKVGFLVGDVDANGAIRSVHDIDIPNRRSGLGSKIMAHLAANSPEPLKIQDITHDAEPFWNKLGTGYITANRDGYLPFDGARRYLAERGRGRATDEVPGLASAGGREAEGRAADASRSGLPETHELTPEEARALGFPDEPLAHEPDEGPPPDTAPPVKNESIDDLQARVPAVHAAPAQGMTNPVQTASGLPAPRKPLTTPGGKIADWAKGVRDDFLMKVSPMSLGSDYARAKAKDYANADRLARWQWSKFDEILKRNYTEEQRKAMWEAADEHNVLLQKGQEVGAHEGLNQLDKGQRDTMDVLHGYGEQLLERAKAVGLFKGEGLPYWTPRIAVMIGEDGSFHRPASGVTVGHDVTVSSNSLKQRKYLTSEETEAAMKRTLGDNAQLVRDIRTMPLAMARLERAIAGRELVNSIKEVGERTGTELVNGEGGQGFFTIDHPAFKTFQHKMVKDPKTGKQVWAKDQFDRLVYESTSLHMDKQFEGPLRAILYDRPGAVYQALMTLKGKSMGVIMYSPLIHNAVEWGRAMPMMPGKVLTFQIYFAGNKVKNDPVQMRQAIKDGLAPIGHRAGVQDITGLMEDPSLEAGRSWTAKGLAYPVGLVSKRGAEAVKRGVDKAGDVWHNTLLWDRVADLQAGLYAGLKQQNMAKGLDEASAGRLAAHWANRFAGALPNEAMSGIARKTANLAMFSRSFTLGNLGAMKDIATGFPKDIEAQIRQYSGEATLNTAKSMARRKALGAFMVDIALMYGANQAAQAAFANLAMDKSWGDIGQGYVDRFQALLKKVHERPGDVMNSPLESTESLLQTSENEPGKGDRVRVGTQADGRALYMRVPVGKVGEDFKNWLTSPIKTAKAKTSQLVKPLSAAWNNDDGLGHKIYDSNEPGFTGALHSAGRIAALFMEAQVPADVIAGAAEWAKGSATAADKLKVVGPLAGLTFSQGAPGGPALGEEFDAKQKADTRTQFIMPDVLKALKEGDIDKAKEVMQSIPGITPKRMESIIRKYTHPESRDTAAGAKAFNRVADEDQKARMERVRANQD